MARCKQVPRKSTAYSGRIPSSSSECHTSKLDGGARTRAEMDSQNRKKIQKNLNSDREGIRSARSLVAKKPGFLLLDSSEQERQLEQAALSRVQRRIDEGLYVSCAYPEFEGYVTPIAYGKMGHVKDPVKDECFRRQLEALRQEPDSDDKNDDDEEDLPPFKAEGNTKQQKMSEFMQFIEKNETRLAKDNVNTGHEGSNNEAKNDKKSTADRLSKGRSTTAHISKRTKVDKSHYENNKKETIRWRAVSRGQPLLPGWPTPNLKQWKPKSNPWLGRVVFRGQIMAENGEGKD